MLLTLLYHRAKSPKSLKQQLIYIKEHYPIALPGDALIKRKIQICLTFDDAYFDFFHVIYPMLLELSIKAVLAVPTAFIMDHTNESPNTRLKEAQSFRFTEPQKSSAFCTWEELQIMQNSGQILMASHSHQHFDMRLERIDPDFEALKSKQLLETKLGCAINTFVYPYGYFNKSIQKILIKHYPYIMRIGNALNFSWKNPTYRISADHIQSIDRLFTGNKQLRFLFRYFLNQVRCR
ncbi:MAG: polysaccharide deacetylase family protein [Simkaniaceae bacterium]|nr:polysaccharide deacetylase family protein [Simkaniaceae bacterium]